MTLREYAPKARAEPPKVVEFAMIFVRDGVEERHEFAAVPTLGWQDVRGLMPLIGGKLDNEELSEHAIRVVDRLIRRALRNDDGTPEKWRPNTVGGYFTDPQGDHTPEELLPAYEAFESGSSRRRWTHLMENDDDVTVEAEQIMDLMADLMETTAERPTQRSARS